MTLAAGQTIRFSAPKTAQGTVLLIEDDTFVARSLIRIMNQEGYQVVHVGSGASAVEKVMSRSFDAVISDLNLPGASGVDVLNVVRAYDPRVPLVLMTGAPTVDTAIEACSLGVLEYLVKPTPREQLVRVLGRIAKARRAPRHADDVQTIPPPAFAATVPAMPASLAAISGVGPSTRTVYERALATLNVELEPIADAKTKKLVGYAARMSSSEETMTTEAALVEAAERLDCLVGLRRRVRDLAVKAFAGAPPDALLFIDVHSSDLKDSDLYSPEPPLARIAERVVLQVHAKGLSVEDLSARASVLRFVGFRLAVADLDPARASLTEVANLSPEFVKIDARLVRGLDGAPPRRRVVAALASMCRALDAVAIAEGVSTAEECDALVEAGCAVVQGPLVRRHALPPAIYT